MSLIPDDLARRIARDYTGNDLDGYEIHDLHRVGGTSLILIGMKDGQRVAIKIYAQELFDESGAELERINRQVEKKHLQHPNLVRTHGSGVCPKYGYHYLVMDFVDDPTLTEIVNELTSDQIRLIIEKSARAAIYIHEKMQLVHRDIKPDNIAVRQGDNHVTILDLGLVRPVIGSTVTDHGSQHIKGTKRYAPPELIQNTVKLNDDGWLAVTFYQLGATLYEMLTKRQPFAEFEGDELLNAIRHKSLTIDAPSAPADLVKLALDCLSKDPEKRLRLVDWRRFLNAPDSSTQLVELSEAVANLSRTAAHFSLPQGAEESQRKRKVLAEMSNEVELSIRSFLSGNEDLFAGYTVDRWQEVETDNRFVYRIQTDFAVLNREVNAYSIISTEITDVLSRSCTCELLTSTNIPQAPLNLDSARLVYQGAFVQGEYRRVIGNELARNLTGVLGNLQ